MASEAKLEKSDSIHFTDADFLLDFADLTLEKVRESRLSPVPHPTTSTFPTLRHIYNSHSHTPHTPQQIGASVSVPCPSTCCFPTLRHMYNSHSHTPHTPQQIGAGNFAAVWQGTYRSGPVAIKRQTLLEKELDKYLEKEMAILKTVSHPNLLRFIGACREGKHVYIVTELLEANLEEVLDRKDVPLGWRLRVEIAHECASALAYLHERKLIHRDMKTANVVLDQVRLLQPLGIVLIPYINRVHTIRQSPMRLHDHMMLCPTHVSEALRPEKSSPVSLAHPPLTPLSLLIPRSLPAHTSRRRPPPSSRATRASWTLASRGRRPSRGGPRR